MTKNILLVEYDESTINIIKEILPQPMFDVAVANDGETAKRKLAARSFDMMITAAMLPRFHGFNLALAVAEEYPEIKIVIISAIYKGFYYKNQATSQYRADDFFEKPLEKVSFKNRVLELLNMSVNAATTNVPLFDTAKIPTLAKLEEEENKLSADDIFGDLIKNIEKVPEYEIELNNGQSFENAKPKKDAPRQAAPAQTATHKEPPSQPIPPPQTVTMKNEPVPARDIQKQDSGKTQMPIINSELNKLRQQPKTEIPENKMKRLEDDIAKKLEDTLSGLGFQKRLTAADKAEAKTTLKVAEKIVPGEEVKEKAAAVIVPDKQPVAQIEVVAARKKIEDFKEIIPDKVPLPQIEVVTANKKVEEIKEVKEIKKEIIPDKVPLPQAEMVAANKKLEEARDVKVNKIEKKPLPEDNPNELGDYVLLGLIARGGMAEIYKAKRKGVKGFEKIIAIKKILSGYGEDDKYVEMLVDEAKIAAELSHPNIIQIYDLGRKDNYYFIAMEYVLGKDLREIQGRLREKDQWFPEEISLFLIIKILEALNYAHKAKDSHGHALEIVHRDVSPPNILISYNGDVKLTDFGISKASIKMHHTISGALKGKLLYMSPEQARGEGTIDCRSDLYSVGVVLFELLTGKKLFLDTSEMGVLKKVQNGEIISPREINPDIDLALEKIILRSLNKTCDKRYQSAAAMIADIEMFMIKKYNYMPGPVQLSHFIYDLFEKEIVRDGIKVDLKPLPEKPLLREIPKMQPELPKPVQEIKVMPAVVPLTRQIPQQPQPLSSEEEMHIDFDEDKSIAIKKKAVVEPKEIKNIAPLFKEIHEEKSKTPLLAIAGVVVFIASITLLYFMVFKKPVPVVNQPAAKPPIVQTPIVQKQPPVVDPQVLAAEKLKQEEELKKLELATAEKKKLQEERRAAKQAEDERLKKLEEDRIKQEEIDRLQMEEAQKKQDEIDRLAKEAAELKKAEELKEIERNRVKEGDIIPLNDVDTAPVAVSTPSPVFSANMRANMMNNQSVLFNILINQNGDVEVARLLQKTNNAQLNTVLIASIKTWKYTPATKKGVRVKVWKTVPLIIKK